MDLLHVVLIIFVVGVLVWLMNRAPFIDAEFKQILNYIALALVVLWVVSLFFGWPNIRIGRV